MYIKKEIGKIGEEIACKYLNRNDYNILERNFTCKQGEIDIISQDLKKKELVFIEVKTRSNLKYGMPSEAVNKSKKKHILEASNYYTYLNKIKNIPMRIDVIEIYITNSKRKINHIKNAIAN